MGEKSTMFSCYFLQFEQLHQLLLLECCRKEMLAVCIRVHFDCCATGSFLLLFQHQENR